MDFMLLNTHEFLQDTEDFSYMAVDPQNKIYTSCNYKKIKRKHTSRMR